LEAAIRKAQPTALIQLIPSSGGTFIVHVDGEKRWDKLADDSGFPDETKFASSL
jgi:predicted Rdx family selenoprotein